MVTTNAETVHEALYKQLSEGVLRWSVIIPAGKAGCEYSKIICMKSFI